MPEKGYYHPSRGYWQTISVPTAAQLAAFPEGTIEVTLQPGPGLMLDPDTLAWVPDPDYIAPEDRVPAEISRIQFVRAMRALGLWDTHRATIEAHPDWPYITGIPRNDPLTLAVAALMEANETQLDDIWRLGATL